MHADHGIGIYRGLVKLELRGVEGEFLRLEYAEASRLLSDSLQINREHDLSVPFLHALWVKGLALVVNGEYDEALSTINEGLALSEKLGDEVFGHRILNGLGWLYSECGDLDRAIDLSQQAATSVSKRGDTETIS